MALHRYTLDVEYNMNPVYHPLTVTVKASEENDIEFSGKTLSVLLKKATKYIKELEDEKES